MVLAGIVMAIVIPLASLFIRRTPDEVGLAPDGTGEASGRATQSGKILIVNKEWASTDWTLRKALGTYQLWLMFLVFMCYSISFNLVVIHQPIHCEDIGFSAMFAASIFGLAGFTTIVGNLGSFISDRIGRERTYTLGTLGMIIGVCALMVVTTSQVWLVYIYAVFFGISVGIITPVSFSSGADLFAGKHFGAINGFILLGFGVGGALGPWFGGYIFDVAGNYTLAFITTNMIIAASCAFVWLAAPRRVRLIGKHK
ncbi:L-lactate transporter [subsurface metagenome]